MNGATRATINETARLIQVIADLKSNGVSVIFISHRLNEVENCADRVCVLRDGRLVGKPEALSPLEKGIDITPVIEHVSLLRRSRKA
jgi:ABC-type sugar transport system ATPase subunit